MLAFAYAGGTDFLEAWICFIFGMCGWLYININSCTWIPFATAQMPPAGTYLENYRYIDYGYFKNLEISVVTPSPH